MNAPKFVEAAYREWAAPRPRSMTDDDFDAFRAGWDASEARIWEEAAKFVSLHGLSPGTRGMCVELAKAMNEKAAALRARGGKQ